MSHVDLASLKAPERFGFSKVAAAIAAVLVLLGAGAFVWGVTGDHPEQAWGAYLMGVSYALMLGIFGAVWVATTYLTRGTWSVTMRRIPEAMTAWLLPGSVLALLVGLGAHSLYHWSHADVVANDPILAHKAPFLNMGMFYGLMGASFVLWLLFAGLIVRNSRKQDETGKVVHTRRNISLSALFIVIFALTFSAVSFYLLMSLDAHWFSTMFAVLTFTDMMQSGLAVVAIVASIMLLKGSFNGFVNENHLHSVGKMLFAATGFWAYVYFCQFLLIWYANIPEETIYFIRRWESGWLPYMLALPALKFLIPFLVMLPRNAKRNPKPLIAMGVLVLFAQFWELYIMVAPALGHGDHVAQGHIPLVELPVTLGFLGLFYLVFAFCLSRNKPIPLKDPHIRECLEYHQ